jgi:hypothetical protein
MANLKILSLSLPLFWTQWVGSQQFEMYRLPYESMGLSMDCVGVLNTTLSSCDSVLAFSTTMEVSLALPCEANHWMGIHRLT